MPIEPIITCLRVQLASILSLILQSAHVEPPHCLPLRSHHLTTLVSMEDLPTDLVICQIFDWNMAI